MSNNFGQSVNGQGRSRANTSRRPATAMGSRGPDPDTSTGSQCTNPTVYFSPCSQHLSSSYAPPVALISKKLRSSVSTPSFIPTASPAIRESVKSLPQGNSRQSSLSSLSSKFGHMTINEEGESDHTSSKTANGGQATSRRNECKAARDHRLPEPRLSDTSVRPGRRAKAVGQ
jgi:hypothetical protein